MALGTSSIDGLQSAMKAEAARQQADREKQPPAPATPPAEKQPEKPPPETKHPATREEKPKVPDQTLPKQPPAKPETKPEEGVTEFNLAQRIKEKYDVDLSDDEILSRLKGTGTNGTPKEPPAPHREKGALPKPEDITETVISKFFTDNKHDDLVGISKANAGKDDTKLVRENYLAQIKQQFPKMDDDQLEGLFNERYYIPESNDDDTFTSAEQDLGKWMLKQDADRIRNAVAWQIDSVRNMLHGQAMNEFNNKEFADTVDSFVQTMPLKITLPLGKSGSIDLGDYPIEIKPETMETVRRQMRSPADFIKRFMDEKGQTIDLQKMYDFFIRSELFDPMIKSTASDYYSKGAESVKNILNNNPDLSRNNRPPDPKDTKKEEQKKAEEFNQSQLGKNMGRGRIR